MGIHLDRIKKTWGEAANDIFSSASVRCVRHLSSLSKKNPDWKAVWPQLQKAKKEREQNLSRGFSSKSWTPADITRAEQLMQMRDERPSPASARSSSHNSTIIAAETALEVQSSVPRAAVELSDDEDEVSASLPRRPLFDIRPEKFRCLSPGEWLNDQIIHGVSQLVEGALGTKAIAIIDSLSIGDPFRSTPRLQRAKISALIALPIQLVHHWVVAFIYKSHADIDIYDSLPTEDHFVKAQTEVKRVYRILTGEDFDGQYHYTIPHYQQNGFDCGVHVLATLIYKAVGSEVPTWIDATCCRRMVQAMVGPPVQHPPAFQASFDIPEHLALVGNVSSDRLSLQLQQLFSIIETQHSTMKVHTSRWASSFINPIQILKRTAQDRGSQVAPEVLSRLQLADECLRQDITNHTRLVSDEKYFKRLQRCARMREPGSPTEVPHEETDRSSGAAMEANGVVDRVVDSNKSSSPT